MINAITLALMDAAIEMKDMLIGCSCGLMNDESLSSITGILKFLPPDMSYQEEIKCHGELVVGYLSQKERVAFMQLSNSKMQTDQFLDMVELAQEGCKKIESIVREVTKKNFLSKLISSI